MYSSDFFDFHIFYSWHNIIFNLLKVYQGLNFLLLFINEISLIQRFTILSSRHSAVMHQTLVCSAQEISLDLNKLLFSLHHISSLLFVYMSIIDTHYDSTPYSSNQELIWWLFSNNWRTCFFVLIHCVNLLFSKFMRDSLQWIMAQAVSTTVLYCSPFCNYLFLSHIKGFLSLLLVSSFSKSSRCFNRSVIKLSSRFTQRRS